MEFDIEAILSPMAEGAFFLFLLRFVLQHMRLDGLIPETTNDEPDSTASEKSFGGGDFANGLTFASVCFIIGLIYLSLAHWFVAGSWPKPGESRLGDVVNFLEVHDLLIETDRSMRHRLFSDPENSNIGAQAVAKWDTTYDATGYRPDGRISKENFANCIKTPDTNASEGDAAIKDCHTIENFVYYNSKNIVFMSETLHKEMEYLERERMAMVSVYFIFLTMLALVVSVDIYIIIKGILHLAKRPVIALWSKVLKYLARIQKLEKFIKAMEARAAKKGGEAAQAASAREERQSLPADQENPPRPANKKPCLACSRAKASMYLILFFIFAARATMGASEDLYLQYVKRCMGYLLSTQDIMAGAKSAFIESAKEDSKPEKQADGIKPAANSASQPQHETESEVPLAHSSKPA